MIPTDLIDDWETKYLIVYEAFIRRAALLGEPFMLKGSIVTRQYFPDAEDREVGDIDWLYMNHIDEKDDAEQIFDDWMTKVTELTLADEVVFRSFKKNRFWRRIDYAMADDFPTVNTDLAFRFGTGIWVDDLALEQKHFGVGGYDEISLDVSFNLPMKLSTIPLLYQPLLGEAFWVPYTPTLALQIAWKLHQTIVRPRLKDIRDLCVLVAYSSYNSDSLGMY